MKTVCIVQARMGSTRLPGKVLLPLNGHSVIGEVLTRCRRIAGVDEVVCAIPLTKGNDKLADEAANYCKVDVNPCQEGHAGPHRPRRATSLQTQLIVRITGDC